MQKKHAAILLVFFVIIIGLGTYILTDIIEKNQVPQKNQIDD